MKVLFVSPVVPWPPDSGGRIRTAKLLKYLAPHAEVHLFAVRQPDLPAGAHEELSRLAASVRFFERSPVPTLDRPVRSRAERWFHSAELRAALAAELARGGWDLVHLDEPVLARALPEDNRTPVCVHHHKLDTLLHERLPGRASLRNRLEGLRLSWLEAEAARRSRHHVLASAEDAAVLSERFPRLATQVVPCGFDPEYFTPCLRPPARERARLLFLGTMDYAPNVDGLAWMLRAILPRVRSARGDVQLDVVGRDPAPSVLSATGPDVRVIGGVRDVRPHLDRATCLVAPLRVGGGTRIKLLEALALRCPVVATPAAAEGLALEHGRHLLLAESADGVARAVLDLLADPTLGARLGREGRRRALERYRWDALARELEHAWRRIVESHPQRPGRRRPARLDAARPALPAAQAAAPLEWSGQLAARSTSR